MKSLSRNIAIALFLAFAIGSIYGCAEKPMTFAGPGVQIWKLNILWEDGFVLKDQTLVLKPSETEKDVFYVTATIDTERESGKWGKYRLFWEWKGEVRNGMMLCNLSGISSALGSNPPGSILGGTVKGTFSKRRAAGTFQSRIRGGSMFGRWTAERIS
jgi:hypothetical protein